MKICLPKELTSQNNDDPDEVSVRTFFVNIQDDNGIRVIIFQKILKKIKKNHVGTNYLVVMSTRFFYKNGEIRSRLKYS